MASASLESMLDIDVTDVLPTVATPTLVLHCEDDYVSVDAGRYIASSIDGATFVELAGADHFPFSGNHCDELVDHVERFVGAAGAARASTRAERFGIILFTDIVGSTELLARQGDLEWRRTLGNHDAMVRDRVDEAGGVCIKFTGDGYLMAFTSPEVALRSATQIVHDTPELGFEVHAGIHAGPYISIGEDMSGIAVHTAARILDQAGPSEILVSAEVRKLVAGSGFTFKAHGPRQLKGINKPSELYTLVTDPLDGPRPASWTDHGPNHRERPRRIDRSVARISAAAPRFTRALTRLAGG